MNLFLLALCLGGNPDLEEKTYLTLRHIPVTQRETVESVVSFTINSLSHRNHIIKPEVVGDTLVIDRSKYKINKYSWDKLCVKHPGKTIRADWFVINALSPDHYYDLLGFDDLDEYHKRLSCDKKFESRAVVSSSDIVAQERLISVWPSLHGSVWATSDMTKSSDLFNKLEATNCDSREYAGFLPNGLIAYFITDGKNKRLDYVDPRITAKMSKIAITCFACHTDGIMSFKDSVRSLVKDKVTLMSRNTELIDMFMSDINSRVKRDQNRYKEAVKKATGLATEDLSKAIQSAQENYELKLVDLSQASLESGITKEELYNIFNTSSDARMIQLRNKPIRRDWWEEIFSNLHKMSLVKD